MKNLFVPILCLLFALKPATAQYKPGMVAVGGYIHALGSNGREMQGPEFTDNQQWNLDIEPAVGYYYDEHSAIGTTFVLGVNTSNSKLNDTGTTESRMFTYGLSPFWRYNESLTDKLGLYHILSPSISYSFSDGTNPPRLHDWQFGASGQMGAYYFVGQKLSIEVGLISLGYMYRKDYANDVEVARNNYYNLVLQAFQSISIFYYF